VHSDGRSRLFGFVGYRTEKEAKAAMNFFNNTFIDTSKISIEMARPVRTRAAVVVVVAPAAERLLRTDSHPSVVVTW
jgi:RNA recognition motif-containing protein